MRQGDIIPQADGSTRYPYICPRGTIAIDDYPDGEREVTRCLGGARLTARDLADAQRLHEDLLAESDDY